MNRKVVRIKRKPNDPAEFVVETTQAVVDALDELVAMGIFGFDRADCAGRILAEKIRELLPPVRLRPRSRTRG